MATKIFKWFSSSSIVTCRRIHATTSQQTGAKLVKPFNWSGNWIPSTRCSYQTVAMASSTASDGGAEVKKESTELEVSTTSELTTPVLVDTPKDKKPETTPSSSTETVTPENSANSAERGTFERKVRKVKAAILLSYSGQGYFGMQIQNSGARTIENDLMKAFYDAGVVDKEGFEKPKSIKFQRAARTDKNVSAARNIVSLLVPKDFEVDSVNKFLPDQIRVMDFRRVTKGFDAKNTCCSRTYLYMIPTFAFVPLEGTVTEEYRISPEVLENLRTVLKGYEGTKNYHNFTSRKKATDPSAFRYIMSFTTSEPFVKDGLEYLVLKVKGQSFMLHQIRKMIGLAVATLRGFANEETMKKAFTLDRIDIPMAPGLGLMLGEAHFDHYNKKFGNDGIHEPLIWDNVEEKVEAFCREQIYTVVTRTENEEKSTFEWLSTVPFHTYDITEDSAKKGYGPLGKAFLHVKRVNGEDSDEVGSGDDEDAEDDGLPIKKQRVN